MGASVLAVSALLTGLPLEIQVQGTGLTMSEGEFSALLWCVTTAVSVLGILCAFRISRQGKR